MRFIFILRYEIPQLFFFIIVIKQNFICYPYIAFHKSQIGIGKYFFAILKYVKK